jgi:hypothetical protein
VEEPRESIKQDKKRPAISSLVISEPRKLADYRCLNDFTAADKLEMTLKKDALVQVLQRNGNGSFGVHRRGKPRQVFVSFQAGGLCNTMIREDSYQLLILCQPKKRPLNGKSSLVPDRSVNPI